MRKKKLFGKTGALMLATLLVVSCIPVGISAKENDKFKTLKFDMGGAKTESGYIGISASDKYSSSVGYGFENTDAVENVSASGQGALSDAVRFKSNVANHIFSVDLPVGVYKITVTTGDDKSTSITAEGRSQLLFMTGSNAVDSFTIPVTDGQLNIYPTSGVGDHYSICALEIEQTSTGTETKPTIWVYGDSTVCNYYNVPDTYAHGWGQVLAKYVNTDVYDVRNMAINGMDSVTLSKHSSFELSEYYGKPGDILILSLGINDYRSDKISSSDYVKAMTDMVKRAKKKGMKVYIAKQQGLLGDCGIYPIISKQWYSDEIDKIASSENVEVLDLFHPWLEFCLEQTNDIVPMFYQSYDDGRKNEIHPNRRGAEVLAQIAARQLFPAQSSESVEDVNRYDSMFADSSTVVYDTEAYEGPISNPHKGFVLQVDAPYQFESDYKMGIGGSAGNKAWDVVSVCYGVLFWDDLNPQEGKYDWSSIDAMLEACEKHNMTYGIRILPYSTGSGSDDNYGEEHDFVPKWVYDKGAKRDIATYKYGDPSVKIKIPNWSDPIYIDSYKKFITALGQRYNGDPRVEFVEIRAFGNFGEWHTSQFVGNEMPSVELQKDMLDHYLTAFPDTTLCALSDLKGEAYEYALSKGITKRNDGLIMTPNEEWDLIPAYRANYPTYGDYHNQYKYMKNLPANNTGNYLPWTETRFREIIEIPHLTMLSLDMDSTFGYDIYREQKKLVDEMSHRLGYNFNVTQAQRNGNKLLVKVKNTGLAPAFFDVDLCAEITDEQGNKLENFGEPIRISKGTFKDGTERAFIFEYNGKLESDANICLALYESAKTGTDDSIPTVRFDNKNTLPNNRLLLSGEIHTCQKAVHVKATKATCENAGIKAHYECSCGKLYEDASCKKLIENEEDLIDQKPLGHDFSGDFDGFDETSHWHICNRKGCDATDEHTEHHGGMATLSGLAVCEDCKQPYGSVLSIPNVVAPTFDKEVVYNPNRTLNEIKMKGVAAEYNGSAVAGNWSWKNGEIVPSVGITGYTAVFTPDQKDKYAEVETEVELKIVKAKTETVKMPVIGNITYGDKIGDASITGGKTDVPGVFVWEASDGAIRPTVAEASQNTYTIEFRPNDSVNYECSQFEVKVVVAKAECAPNMPSEQMNPSFETKTVSEISLPKDWKWSKDAENAGLEPGVACDAMAVYVGTDAGNYEKESVLITITRSECKHILELRDKKDASCSQSGYTGDYYCKVCGELITSGSETATVPHKGGVANCKHGKICSVCGMEYGDTDPNNHVKTEVRNKVSGSCTVDSYTGDVYCTECNELLEQGYVDKKAPGHSYISEITTEPTSDADGVMTYTCTECGHTYTETIVKLPEEVTDVDDKDEDDKDEDDKGEDDQDDDAKDDDSKDDADKDKEKDTKPSKPQSSGSKSSQSGSSGRQAGTPAAPPVYMPQYIIPWQMVPQPATPTKPAPIQNESPERESDNTQSKKQNTESKKQAALDKTTDKVTINNSETVPSENTEIIADDAVPTVDAPQSDKSGNFKYILIGAGALILAGAVGVFTYRIRQRLKYKDLY